jgi:hypothetical protein
VSLLFAVAFLLSGIGVFSQKQRTFAGIKAFFILLVILGIGGGMLIKIKHTPLSFGIQEGIWICCLLFLISFIITLEIQQRRLKTSLAELPENQKSDKKQRVSAFVVFVVVSVLTVVYFIIGKQVQTVPFVPDTYFDKTRENPNLSEEENGYEQLRKLIGDTTNPLSDEQMEKYPFVYKAEEGNGAREIGSSAGYGNKLSPTDPNYLTAPRQRSSTNRKYGEPEERFSTFAELLTKYSDIRDMEKVETLMQSDFFDRLAKIVEMERKNTDTTLPQLQNIQTIERVMLCLVAYYADTGDLETAVRLNSIALKLGDKYLSSYGSFVQGLIGIVVSNLAVNGTEYLLSRYELPEEQRLALLETYQKIMTTNREEAMRNISRGEYHAILEFANGFKFDNPDEIDQIGGGSQPIGISALGALFLRKPFYDRELTLAQYKYALQQGTESLLQGIPMKEMFRQIGINSDSEDFFERPQARNRYNIAGDIVLSALLPRLEGSNAMLNSLYDFKDFIVGKLKGI